MESERDEFSLYLPIKEGYTSNNIYLEKRDMGKWGIYLPIGNVSKVLGTFGRSLYVIIDGQVGRIFRMPDWVFNPGFPGRDKWE